MPIYEYGCTKCGHHLEVMQKMSDKPLTRCPECKGKLEKQFSQTSFQLKGGGWYVTDYAKSGASKTDKSEKKTEPAAEKKADSVPEKKADKTEKKAESAAA